MARRHGRLPHQRGRRRRGAPLSRRHGRRGVRAGPGARAAGGHGAAVALGGPPRRRGRVPDRRRHRPRRVHRARQQQRLHEPDGGAEPPRGRRPRRAPPAARGAARRRRRGDRELARRGERDADPVRPRPRGDRPVGGVHALSQMGLRGHPPDEYPLLLHFPYYLLYSSQVVKQADLVFALYVCGDQFDAEQKARDFDYYERITVRDSSLSAAVQAIVAAEVGHLDLAYDYFGETAFIDLRDLAFNTRDGLHLASLAGSWLVVVAGFGGMRDHGDTLQFSPRLPARLTRLSFRLVFRGRRLRVDVTPDAATYALLDGEALELVHDDERLTVRPGEPETRPLPPVPRRPTPVAPRGRRPPRRHDEA